VHPHPSAAGIPWRVPRCRAARRRLTASPHPVPPPLLAGLPSLSPAAATAERDRGAQHPAGDRRRRLAPRPCRRGLRRS
jgi:hypothetical protein